MKHVLIIGAGISGLSAAWYLRNSAKITILEKTSRVGGWIKTCKKEEFLFEEGPRGFLAKGNGQSTCALVRELGLTQELIDAKNSTRYLLYKGQLKPVNFLFLLRLNLLSLCFKEWHLKSFSSQDESIGDFFSRRFHPKLVSNLIDPMVKGIFGGDPYQLSMQSCFPKIYQWEKQFGSVTKGFIKTPKSPSILYSFRDGMETLPKKLAEEISSDIHLNTMVESINSSEKKIFVKTSDQSFEADHVIAAIPSNSLQRILITSNLPKIPHLTLTTVHFGYFKPLLKHKGFGYLVASQEEEKILGMTWDSQIFPRDFKHTVICVMIAGHCLHAEEIAQEAISRHLKIDQKPDCIHIHTAHQAIAQYPVGYQETLQNFHSPHLSLLGPSYYGPGINDCIFQASKIQNVIKIH